MALEVKVPVVGESINEVTVSRWLKQDGDWVEMDEVLAELESDKATFELNAEKSGVLKTSAKEGDTVAVGAVICTIDTEAKRPEGKEAAKEEKKEVKKEAKTETPVSEKSLEKSPAPADKKTSYASGIPSPAANKILAEKGVEPSDVNGSGKGGRITKSDALKAAPLQRMSNSSEESSRDSRKEKMSNLRKTISRRLVAAKNETAMLTTFNEVDMKPIMDLRSKYKDKFKEKHGVSLGFMSFFTKAVCEALKLFPAVNAYLDGDSLEYHDYCDISIAVSGPKGLVVPVIRNAESLGLAGIEKEVAALAAKARDNKLTIEEMSGGTFTITNGGVFGSMMSTPILNPPQSAILGMHNIVERPVVRESQIVIRPMMYVALSYDHRVIDGRESVGFLVKVKQMLENPQLLLSGGKELNELVLDL